MLQKEDRRAFLPVLERLSDHNGKCHNNRRQEQSFFLSTAAYTKEYPIDVLS